MNHVHLLYLNQSLLLKKIIDDIVYCGIAVNLQKKKKSKTKANRKDKKKDTPIDSPIANENSQPFPVVNTKQIKHCFLNGNCLDSDDEKDQKASPVQSKNTTMENYVSYDDLDKLYPVQVCFDGIDYTRKYHFQSKRYLYVAKDHKTANPWHRHNQVAPFDTNEGLFHRFYMFSEKRYRWQNFQSKEWRDDKPPDELCAPVPLPPKTPVKLKTKTEEASKDGVDGVDGADGV
ncbi:hypothetical protein RFI_25073 [Reticulomyxa filosa]|uniref:Uncharacterized protein n=1 Tax=Reticulomyxa filosa TaxID=46433 RepID=X6ME69_RETFI|nr:hypothetical protein RFI_25073 [Reticulomyxa filosa]|eukprot:ETO12303.1 hypothetical protein RFI_25073 [Reticulomyxa filosa]